MAKNGFEAQLAIASPRVVRTIGAAHAQPRQAIAAALRARAPEWLLVAIILTIPLEVTKTFFPIQQIEVSRLLMGVAIAWLICGRRWSNLRLPRPLTITVGAVLTVLATSFMLTRWPDGALIVLAPVYYSGFAVFVASTVRDRYGLIVTGSALVVSGALVAGIAITQELGDFYLWREGVLDVLGRANATFGDPNITARFLILSLVTLLAASALPRRRDRRLDLAVGSTVALMAAGLVLTQSRLGWIVLIVVLPLLAIAIRPRRIVIANLAVFAATFFLVAAINGTAASRAGEVAAGVSYSLGGQGSISGRGNLTGVDDQPYYPPREVAGHQIFRQLPIDGVRYYLLEAGVAMWEDHPIVGVGTGGFRQELLGPYRAFIPLDRLAAPTALPHTFVAQIMAENGVVGLAAVVAMLTALIWTLLQPFRSPTALLRNGAVVVGLSLLTIFLSSQAEGRFLGEPYLWLAVGVAAALHRKAADEGASRQPG